MVEEGAVLDLGAVLGEAVPDLRTALTMNSDRIAAAMPSAPRYLVTETEFLPVIPNPVKILCVGHNYESHRKETGREKAEYPSIFVRFPDSQIGHLQPLLRPRVSSMFDYEGELAVVIGKAGRAIPEADALHYVVRDRHTPGGTQAHHGARTEGGVHRR
jgi:2-keto-4-pentenoate hydratase/2-oxohepta-3-ene-1,7-dioic acid hydratase in catechol pathway